MQQGMLQASFVLEVVWHLAQWPNACETFPARIFTSGTTGNPKAVHRSLSAHVMSALQFSDPCQTSFHGKLFGHFVRDTMRKRTTDGRRCVRPRQVNDWKSLAAGQHKRGCNPPTLIFDIWLSPKLGMQIGNMPRLRSSSLNRLYTNISDGIQVTLEGSFIDLFRHCGSWDGRCSLILFVY